ncbi:MAG: chorismate mutase [Acholeplasmatales bacterium]|jgi:shikimate dehydrogenase|nr:chorismate mutase [Acholeplasmatales bacterium]
MKKDNLSIIRENIDKLDKKIINSLEQRFVLSLKVKKEKQLNNLELTNRTREEEIYKKIYELISNKEDIDFYVNIYKEIIKNSTLYQYKRFGLVGNNANTSFSKILHEYIASKNNLKLVYDLIVVKDTSGLLKYYDKLKNGLYDGYNITIPFKNTCFLSADSVSDAARACEAINTIVYKNNQYSGYNTDYLGFESLLEHYKINLENKNILILGNGSAGNTVYQVIFSKTSAVTVAFKEDTTHKTLFYQSVFYSELKDYSKYDIIINTSSYSGVINYDWLDNKTLIDINYKEIIEVPKNRNITYINGFYMLCKQAIYSQRIWFNNENIDMDEEDINILYEIYLKKYKSGTGK